MNDPRDLFETLPRTFESLFGTECNTDIELYAGAVWLETSRQSVGGNGRVVYTWHPTPRIRFDAELDQPATSDLLGEMKLKLVDRWSDEFVDARVKSSRLSSHHKPTVSGTIGDWRHNPAAEISHIVFHLPNFRSYLGQPIRNDRTSLTGRASFASGDWAIEIDEIDRERGSKELKESGGFGMTHVGRISRRDGQPFLTKDAANCLESLSSFLSFCNGRWTGPTLVVGMDKDSKPVSHDWSVPTIAPFRFVESWFSDCVPSVAELAYPGFAARWANETYSEAVRTAIFWYVTANAAGIAVENGLLLAWMAFETLGWVVLVEDTGKHTHKSYDSEPAAAKLRQLLGHCEIALPIPSELPALLAASETSVCNDGPGILTDLRNAHVHPNPKRREWLLKAGPQAELEAWYLSLHYLELILLYLFGYQGDFVNRLLHLGGCCSGEDVRPVPWAATPSSLPKG